jgi:hypothetical protein
MEKLNSKNGQKYQFFDEKKVDRIDSRIKKQSLECS